MPNQFIIYLYLQSNNKKELHDLSENLFNYLPNWEDLAVDYRSNSVYLEYFYIPRFYGIEACQKIIKIFSICQIIQSINMIKIIILPFQE